jgi:hypothetical protein
VPFTPLSDFNTERVLPVRLAQYFFTSLASLVRFPYAMSRTA